MHLPDGFLDAKTAAAAQVLAWTGVAVALRQVRSSLEPRRVPLLGLAAAFVFAAQMINFPVAGGTSGHLLGGVLTAVLLGPAAAVLVMTTVLLVQCLMFADGGLLALGANVFNMALVGVGGGYLVFRLVRRLVPMEERRSTVFAAAFAGWVSTVLASLSCAGQLALSGTVPWSIAFPAMVGVHMLIGIGEGVATGLIVLAVMESRPELVAGEKDRSAGGAAGFIAWGLLVSLGLAIFVAPFASPWPDGLERVAKSFGFEHKAAQSFFPAPAPDYQIPLFGSATVTTAIAGLVGTLIAFAGAWVLARLTVPVLRSRGENAAGGR